MTGDPSIRKILEGEHRYYIFSQAEGNTHNFSIENMGITPWETIFWAIQTIATEIYCYVRSVTTNKITC